MGDDAPKAIGFTDRLQAYAEVARTALNPLNGVAITAGLTRALAGTPPPSDQDIDQLTAETKKDPYKVPGSPNLPMLPGGPGPGAGGALVRVGGTTAAASVSRLGGVGTAVTVYGAIRDAAARPAVAAANAVYHSVAQAGVTAAITHKAATGGPDRPTEVDDKHIGKVNLDDVQRACNAEIAGLSSEERARIGMRNTTDIENHFNGNADMAFDGLERFAKRAGVSPERAQAYQDYIGTVRNNRTYIPEGFKASVKMDEAGNPLVSIVQGSKARPPASLPWKT